MIGVEKRRDDRSGEERGVEAQSQQVKEKREGER
jgi:hypothetical protein